MPALCSIVSPVVGFLLLSISVLLSRMSNIFCFEAL